MYLCAYQCHLRNAIPLVDTFLPSFNTVRGFRAHYGDRRSGFCDGHSPPPRLGIRPPRQTRRDRQRQGRTAGIIRRGLSYYRALYGLHKRHSSASHRQYYASPKCGRAARDGGKIQKTPHTPHTRIYQGIFDADHIYRHRDAVQRENRRLYDSLKKRKKVQGWDCSKA